MRLSPANKATALGVGLMMGLISSVAVAQTEVQTLPTGPTAAEFQAAMASSDPQAALSALSQRSVGYAAPPYAMFAPAPEEEKGMTQAEYDAALKNADSPVYKADALANQAKREGMLKDFALQGAAAKPVFLLDEPAPPPVETLQDIRAAHGGASDFIDEVISEDIAIDIRRDAQKEAALSYGARGGLAKRNYQIMERLYGYEGVLDKVFNFRALLVRAPSGLLIEPPIVKEALDAMVITEGGVEAAVADRVLNINKQAKIVSAPRDWRQYLVMNYATEIAPPPRVLWPKNKQEQAEWNTWVKQGWDAGYGQGEQIFDANINRLVADYNGMVRYRMLLTQGMISQPYALQEDRGVTGGGDEMRVGDRALRITGPSQLLTGADLWKPADR